MKCVSFGFHNIWGKFKLLASWFFCLFLTCSCWWKLRSVHKEPELTAKRKREREKKIADPVHRSCVNGAVMHLLPNNAGPLSVHPSDDQRWPVWLMYTLTQLCFEIKLQKMLGCALCALEHTLIKALPHCNLHLNLRVMNSTRAVSEIHW